MVTKSTFFILAYLVILSANAQSIGPSLLTAAGESFQSENIHLDWSLGEVMVESFSTAGTTLTQGFHQAEIDLVTGFEDQLISISIYPNPASESVSLKTDYHKYPELRTTIHDLSGKTVLESTINGTRNLIDISTLKEGVYYIKIYGNGAILKSSKLIKN